MARGLLEKYIWVLETIQRYGRISRHELDRLWQGCSFSGGQPLARRTFYNYRQAIEELFGISIGYDSSTYEYYIAGGQEQGGMSNWLINSMSISGMLSDASMLSDRIMLEEVPSAKGFLPTIIEAMRNSRKIEFSYTPFYRTVTTRGIVLEPYFLRIFRQRWYLIGYNVKERRIKTYSLDRFNEVNIMDTAFDMPEMTVAGFFENCFGITSSEGEVKMVVLRADSEQSKYLRALPLHQSQQEQVCDGYSLFHYRLYITYDFIQELLSFGDKVTVVSPPELKAVVIDTLRKSLSNYER